MKKHIPNFLTCCNLMIGAVGIVSIITTRDYGLLIYFVLIASLFDFADGLAARLLGVQSEIGKQLDSLADLVSFGVLPAIAISSTMNSPEPIMSLTGISIDAMIPLLIIPFSALRLARFNVSTDQSEEFRGLPTPANALMVGAFLLLGSSFLTPHSSILITVISCFLLVSNIRMIAFKFKSMSWNGNELRYLLIAILLIGFTVLQLSFIPFVIPTYIAVSIVGNYVLEPVVFK